MTVSASPLLADLAKRLASHGVAEAGLEARLLLGAALGLSQEEIICGIPPLTPAVRATLEALLVRRCRREPLAYILGRREFWGLPLRVGPGVLIPRPETETLIEHALSLFRIRRPRRILDLGTGSGALLLAALAVFPESRGVGVDRSPAALRIAALNAEALGFGERASFIEGGWEAQAGGGFDLVLCNPPYVRRAEIATLAPEIHRFEPREALDGGEDGLEAYHALLPALRFHLARDGVALLEVGQGQAAEVISLAEAEGFVLRGVRVDLGGVVRSVAFGCG